MTRGPLVFAVVLLAVAAPAGVGAVAPGGSSVAPVATPTTPTGGNTSPAPSLGQSISAMMQASVAQTAGTVENGMWAAAYANASNASEKRALVERRASDVGRSLAALEQQRRELRAAFRNGTINRTTYVARLSTIVGRLAGISEGIAAAEQRGAEVGVNRSRLDELRSRARNLTGPAVSRLARNLTGGPGPGQGGLFGRGPPDQGAERGPGNRSAGASNGDRGQADRGNGSDAADGQDRGRSDSSGNASADRGQNGSTGSAGNRTAGSGNGQGQSESGGNGSDSAGNGGKGDSAGNETTGGDDDAGGSDSAGNGSDGGKGDRSDSAGNSSKGGDRGDGRSDARATAVGPAALNALWADQAGWAGRAAVDGTLATVAHRTVRRPHRF